jgi:peptide chain release factor 3
MSLDVIQQEVSRRRTFAIISHPDAGKTTLTEKLLLYSGAIHTAGMVKGRKGRKSAASDWMAMEQERGISITSSAMQFSYKNTLINVLDTPGHEDFSEDTYRTLTAADCAVMVIDVAKGVEKQTRKLFEVCRLRRIPVLTFINKMDMPGKDPLDVMHEVENVLQINSYAYNWPIGRDKNFRGVVDRITKECLYFTKTSIGGANKADIARGSLSTLDAETLEELRLLDLAGNVFSRKDFLSGDLTPVFFASALTNFGVEPFFDAFIHLAPCPGARVGLRTDGTEVIINPVTTPFSGYVFKLQANMDRNHRDNLAFIRVCSGRFESDLTVHSYRLRKEIRLARSHGMLAGERTTINRAYPGDIIGVINPSIFAIGDTLSITKGFSFKPLPQFQPEFFARIYPKNIAKRKSFDKGILQLSDEGAIQILKPVEQDSGSIFAAVGRLQFDVMQYRLQDEYGVETVIATLPYQCSSWIIGDLKTFQKSTGSIIVMDRSFRPMVLFTHQWDKQYCMKQNPTHQFQDIRA